ncbi:MAG TPA: flagellar assembly protein FliW [Acidobacteriota bacterium]|nr:flagellar assembly protein FliW [Acidobacteriota bacterium]
MLIKTVNFGDLEIPEDRIIEFSEGLPGFPRIHQFAVLELEEVKPFQYLQALGEPPISLLVINPFLIDSQYAFQLSSMDMEEIQATQSGDLMVCAVAAIPENPEEATVNLMAPIVINEKARRGKQVIMLDTKYSLRHPLFKKADGAGAATEVK